MNNFFFSFVLAYLVGSIPTGYWFAKYYFNIDVTRHGSGNIGATNIARVLGKKYFFVIFFLDAVKASLFLGYLQTFWFQNISTLLFLSVALLIGNAYSVFMGFGGGKGVSTALGVLAVLAPVNLTLFFISCWVTILVFLKRADIASISSVLLTTMLCSVAYFNVQYSFFLFMLFLSTWIVFRHKSNLLSLFGMVRGS